MGKHRFRKYSIKRTCTKKLSPYNKYQEDLRKDFHDRCGYCDMQGEMLTQMFQIDHFVPRKAFEKIDISLRDDYDNLVWACPKCNLAKGSKYKGDIEKNRLDNEMFYDPAKVDLNEIFYRNEFGIICSDDDKGREIIKILKLYRPSVQYAWMIERIVSVTEYLCNMVEGIADEDKQQKLNAEITRLKAQYMDVERKFKALYRMNIYLESFST